MKSPINFSFAVPILIVFLQVSIYPVYAQTSPAPGKPTPHQDDRGVSPAHTGQTGPTGSRPDSAAGPMPGGAIATTGATGTGGQTGTKPNTAPSGRRGTTGASGRSGPGEYNNLNSKDHK